MLPFSTTPRPAHGIVIVGLGGAGAHILQRFSGSSAENVRLCIMSPDERLAEESGNVEFLQLGAGMNRGLGSGGDPEVGRLAFEESRESISALLAEARLLVMVVGLGGGTGSGAAPLLAQMASEAGVFLVSVCVMPFGMEGSRRREQADAALEAVSGYSDIVFCFENDYMEELFDGNTKLKSVYDATNTLLAQATASIPLMANSPGLINIGLDELVTALRNSDSRCIYGSGKGFGAHRAVTAARAALASPLVAYHDSLRFAHTVIIHVAGGNNMTLTELRTAVETIREGLPPAAEGEEEVRLFFGASVKPHLGEEMRVSLTASIDATEFDAVVRAEKEAAATPAPEMLPAEEEEEAPAESVADLPEEDIPEDEPTTAPAEEEEEEELFAAPEEEPLPTMPALEPEQRSFFAPDAAPQQSFFNLDGEPAKEPEAEDEFPSLPHGLFEEAPADKSAPAAYSPEAARRRMAGRDDIDTPPSLRFNDLRDMFPDN
ncbi:MAG: hypothetical protein MJ051_03915 [Akkermansia sp.]|nr:hypothetical protein [Akkermansia sp.]